ncbi:olfactory receptor 5V1-like [Lissotriton helveticus]
MDHVNKTTAVLDFTLLGLSNLQMHQTSLFVLFISIYVLTVTGNLAICALITVDVNLHTPMYFFLIHLSFLDACSPSVTVPKMLANFLVNNRKISFGGCLSQLYFFISFLAAECFLLTAMALDRYVAICHPLRYTLIMNRAACAQLAMGSWCGGFLYSMAHTILTSLLHFCGSHEIHHFFCDLPPLLSLSCSDTFINSVLIFAGGVLIGVSSFILTLLSYIKILSTVLKSRSTRGRSKAFSTCISHLTVFTLFLTSLIFVYMRPKSSYSLDSDRLVSVFYSVLTPLLNPIIYTLRNRDITLALRTIFSKKGVW